VFRSTSVACLVLITLACGSRMAEDGGSTAGEETGAGVEGSADTGEGGPGDEGETGEPGDQALCEASGGTWAQNCGGHYDCGEMSCELCLGWGCNCGYWANFVDEVGCVEDPACVPPSCESQADCGDNLICNFGCCETYADSCLEPLVLSWDEVLGCADIPVDDAHRQGRVFSECGLGYEVATECEQGDAVVWSELGLTLCAEACADFEQAGRVDIWAHDCWGPCAGG
jgi:hypothetical protein